MFMNENWSMLFKVVVTCFVDNRIIWNCAATANQCNCIKCLYNAFFVISLQPQGKVWSTFWDDILTIWVGHSVNILRITTYPVSHGRSPASITNCMYLRTPPIFFVTFQNPSHPRKSLWLGLAWLEDLICHFSEVVAVHRILSLLPGL